MVPAHNPQAQQPHVRLVTAAFSRLVQATRRLLYDISSGRKDSPHFDDVHDLLSTVPLATDEHSLSVRRLRNAMDYAARGEAGAARYELTMLVQSVAASSQVQVIG